MEMTASEFRDDAVKISLRGRLDTTGVDAIEKNFGLAAESRHALVDLSGVSFVASMGIRMFFSSARVQKATGYRLILVAPQALVSEVLDNSGLSQIVPVVSDEKLARELLPSRDVPAGAIASEAMALAPTLPAPMPQPPPKPKSAASFVRFDIPPQKQTESAPKPTESPPRKPTDSPSRKPAQSPSRKPAESPPRTPAESPPRTPAEAPPRKPRRETPTEALAKPLGDSRRTIWILAACSGIAVVGLAALLASNVWWVPAPVANPGAGAPQSVPPDAGAVPPIPAPEAREPSLPSAPIAETTPPRPAAETGAPPDAAPGPASAPPAAAQRRPGAPAAETSAVASGTLRLAVKPWGEIVVDGVKKGVSPPLKRLTLAEGKHRIGVTNPGFPTHSAEIEVKKGQSVTLAHEFK